MQWPPENLEELLHRAGDVLREEGAREVYVFGSAAAGRLQESSDVDLAVTGLPARRFIPAMGRVREIFNRPVDLVELTDDTPFTRYLKTEEGELLRVA